MPDMQSSNAPPAVLIVGATGRSGVQLIRAAATVSPRPVVHAFARDPAKLSATDIGLCQSVQQGDATDRNHLSAALNATRADVVIVAVGGEGTKRSSVRRDSAKALMDVVQGASRLSHVRVVVLSSAGAGDTSIELGMGMGKLLTYHLRHVLSDHNNQEHEFKQRMGPDGRGRLLIVRPTALSDGVGTGHVAVYDKPIGLGGSIARGDVAHWIMEQVCVTAAERSRFGQEVMITSVKKNGKVDGRASEVMAVGGASIGAIGEKIKD